MEFSQLVGQERAIELLERAIATQRIAPAYLFAGPDGVGRQLAARAFSNLLLTPQHQDNREKHRTTNNHPDFMGVEPTYLHQGERITAAEAAEMGVKRRANPQIRIEQIREIAEFLSRPPLEAVRAVVVIEEAQAMSEASANALLKTLEEPGRATLILIAPSSEALLPTLVSRCQRIPFYPLAAAQVQQVLEREGYEEILSAPEIIAIAQGSPGAAISAWQQLQAIPSDLLQSLIERPDRALQALELAKAIDKMLDTETQLWLIDYLQFAYWQQFLARKLARPPLEFLERSRQALLSYAQPRLVWEVALCQLTAIAKT
ncbi:DNA polymerase III subunit delta' [Oscillatoria sp. FACHB-1406]|uniref:DNA polymerase III subunit delta' n=1 Tax=Oscillatoria sp. FACHB-1406 TaxID=2692846 RepID=UPI0016824DE8|nr:DNA polymerase III subunit delta' [Oscillatoria sp. FACHB-1406]MBD2578976.1 DNA polymerase III subunit delta' [Oscillatoria sp. FACHB-1406]